MSTNRLNSYKPYPAYKNSGVEWLGDIPAHWEMRRLKHVAYLKSGEAITSGRIREKDEYPVYGGNGLRGYTSTFTHEGNYVLIGRQGALCGNINYASGKFWASEHAVVATIATNQDVFYIGELLRAMNLNQYSISAAQPGLSVDRINNLSLPVPPNEEQQAIGRFLDHKTSEIDTLIAAKERLITLLQEKRGALITHAVTKGLDPSVPMKDSGIEWLGRIPAHWEVVKLLLLTTRIGDGLHGTPNYVDESPYLFINGNNLSQGFIQTKTSTRFVDENEYKKHWVPLDESTLLMSINGTIGNLALYRDESIILGKSAAYMNCSEKLTREFLFYYLQTSGIQEYFQLEKTGTTIFNLSLASIRNLPTLYPPISEQYTIMHFLDKATAEYDLLVENIQDGIEHLQEYRTALISAAVTGKIDVRDT